MILERLKKLRLERGLSQPDIASRLGIPLTTYRSYEQGKREPNNETILKISDVLNTSTDYLLGNDVIKAADANSSLSHEEQRFLSNFINLSADERKILMELMKRIVD